MAAVIRPPPNAKSFVGASGGSPLRRRLLTVTVGPVPPDISPTGVGREVVGGGRACRVPGQRSQAGTPLRHWFPALAPQLTREVTHGKSSARRGPDYGVVAVGQGGGHPGTVGLRPRRGRAREVVARYLASSRKLRRGRRGRPSGYPEVAQDLGALWQEAAARAGEWPSKTGARRRWPGNRGYAGASLRGCWPERREP